MWSKINLRHNFPISVKLTLLYAAILSLILLFTNGITIGGLYYLLYTQAADDLSRSASALDYHLSSGKSPDPTILSANILAPGVMLRITDENNRLLLDTFPPAWPEGAVFSHEKNHSPYMWNNLNHYKYKVEIVRRHFQNNHQRFYFSSFEYPSAVSTQYHISLATEMTEDAKFLVILMKSMFFTNSVGLFIAVISGIFISRKVLRPIRSITQTAKSISIHNMDQRIELSSAKDELHELSDTFNHMLNTIQQGLTRQQRFVADASHELRTPVTVINGYINMLDRWGKDDPATLNESIQAIKHETTNMHSLIEKLLFLARADQGRQSLSKTEICLEKLINELIQETRLIAPDHQIFLEQNDPVTIVVDPVALKQMLRIFIDNSIKYTPPQGTITLKSLYQSDHIAIIIQDTGIGIPPDDQPKIFDRFYRVDTSRTKNTGGTGLGLSIAQWIADQHEGRLELESTLGQGTKITFFLPHSLSVK